MRSINEFKYNWQKFKCWDILVQDYYLFFKAPEDTYKKILTEFNSSIPRLSVEQQRKFLEIVFLSENTTQKQKSDKNDKKIKKNIELFEKEFHITVWFVAKSRWFSRNDIMNMPYFVFKRYLEDIPIITWNKKYDPKRYSNEIDKKSINEVFGWSKVLKSK